MNHPIGKTLLAAAMMLFAHLPGAMAASGEVMPVDDTLEPLATQEAAYVPPTYRYLIGVVEGVSEKTDAVGGMTATTQRVLLRIQGGDTSGKLVETVSENDGPAPVVKKGDRMVVIESTDVFETAYHLGEPYRLPRMAWIVGVFFALVIFFGRIRGITSIFGLLCSVIVLDKVIIAGIMSGKDPLAVTVTGTVLIVLVSLYLAHGFNKRTSVAMAGSLIALVAAYAFAKVAVSLTALAGTGTEEALFLQVGPLGTIDLRGLYLSGIMIGVIGVLDDATTGQVAAVCEIGEADPRLSAAELYRRGLIVGREHIASLVNTLVLAYAGASLPLFLLFSIYKDVPAWVTLNSGAIAEEIVRTVIGSAALVLAVPVTTWLAARIFGPRADGRTHPRSPVSHHHVH